MRIIANDAPLQPTGSSDQDLLTIQAGLRTGRNHPMPSPGCRSVIRDDTATMSSALQEHRPQPWILGEGEGMNLPAVALGSPADARVVCPGVPAC
jgi:hypothetical protein